MSTREAADAGVDAIESLRSAGWLFRPPTGNSLIPAVAERAHSSVVSWTSLFSRLSSADESTWFLSADDYASSPADGFAWNEFELLSQDAALTEEDRAAVSEFWSEHVPILLSVRGGYAYLAVRSDGAIVHGGEPEFEETTVVAPSLDDLLHAIIRRPTPGAGLVESLLFGAV